MGFGVLQVNGLSRVPNPPAMTIAFIGLPAEMWRGVDKVLHNIEKSTMEFNTRLPVEGTRVP
jgi:hypothetical protein